MTGKAMRDSIQFLVNEDGAAAAEYAIVVAFVASAVALAASQFDLGDIFVSIVNKVQELIGNA